MGRTGWKRIKNGFLRATGSLSILPKSFFQKEKHPRFDFRKSSVLFVEGSLSIWLLSFFRTLYVAATRTACAL